MRTGLVSYIQRYSVHDGPGIRTTVFLKGCPLNCAWCHNPENISPQIELVVHPGRCVRCGECIAACPRYQSQGGLSADRTELSVTGLDMGTSSKARFEDGNLPVCTRCGTCVKACPAGARELNGQEKTAAGLVEEVMADRIFFEESDGGITFSGGEPLFQYDFLRSVLESCRSAGLHTAVDTCGHAPGQHLIALAQVTDLFLYDLKFMDDSRHREYTGVSNRLILENLRALAASHSPIWLRVPVIPGINDTPEETDAMALFARSLPAIQMVCLLPYHRAGIGKFRQLKRDYRLPEVVPPEQAHMESIGERFRRLGLRVKIGG